MNNNRVVLLFSGGIDSTVLYYWLVNANYEVHPIHINYGQTTFLGEVMAVKEVAKSFEKLNNPPLFIDVSGIKKIGSGSLVGEISTNNYTFDSWVHDEFFPNRNMILISIGASYAYKLGINKLAIGVVGDSYADTRSPFIKSITDTLSESLSHFEIIAPFVDKSRELVISESERLNVPIERTFSCNCLGDRHCLLCNSCLERQYALELLGKYNAF